MTAIVVRNMDASLRFYKDVLGLTISGASENGVEQEHLNNVFGARLRITSLHAANGGPGIGFLEYLAPRDNRPFPVDERANDLFHRQTMLAVASLDKAVQDLLAAKYSFISPVAVTLGDGQLGISKALPVRDPDGHVMALVEK